MSILDRIRAAAARVAAQASWVTIDLDALEDYAATVPPDTRRVGEGDPAHKRHGSDEASAAYVLTLDAINFGSGYFPYLRKRPGLSGYHTVAASLQEFANGRGGVDAGWLRQVDTAQCVELFGQAGAGDLARELMGHFAAALNELGAAVAGDHGGSFLAFVAAADRSAATLVDMLDRLPHFHDVHRYHGFDVPLYKRAQIAAFDLAMALPGHDVAQFRDLNRLTMFADNLVPHVLRVDGVLRFEDELVARIERVDDITSGSEPEVEIRAVALHAVELLGERLREWGIDLSSGVIDNVLWNRGAGARYKAVPRHRTRCVYY